MLRNLQISKQTEDKVKLAKKFIEDKYQLIVEQQYEYQNNWEKLISQMSKSNLNPSQKHIIATKVIEQQNALKRIKRQKDNLKNYKLFNIIGRGAFGQVRMARNIYSNQIVAIKRLQKRKLAKKKQLYNAYLERDFMAKNKSPYLVQLKSTFQDKDYLYLVMEYVPGGDLLHLLIQKDILSQEQTRFYIAQMVLAVEQIHAANYIHRDIKPDNILLDKAGHVKISDFGLSKFLQTPQDYSTSPLTKINQLKKHMALKGRNKCFSKVGTPDYISPEVLTESSYDFSVDIWGIGVVMFECLFGYPPFSHDDSKQVCHRVVNWLQYLQFPQDVKASTQAKMLILGMMNNRQQRLTIKQIKIHPFFRNFDWNSVRQKAAPIIPKVQNEFDTRNFDQFEQQISWIQQNTKQRKTHHQRARASSAEEKKINFPGFQFTRAQVFDVFDYAKKQITIMTRDKSMEKSIQSRKSTKRIKTQMTQRVKQKNIYRDSTKTQARGSVGTNKENKSKEVRVSIKKTNKLGVMKKKTIRLF